MQFDMGTSMSLYAPPIGTAGFARCLVRGYRRDPAPPPNMIAALTQAHAFRQVTGALHLCRVEEHVPNGCKVAAALVDSLGGGDVYG